MRAYAVARIALLTLFILALASLPGLATDVRAVAPSDNESGRVRVIYFVDQTLGSSYVASIMVTNMTADPIQDWTMQFNLDPVADRYAFAHLFARINAQRSSCNSLDSRCRHDHKNIWQPD